MASDWRKRYEDSCMAWAHLKSLTKQMPASTWTPEYRELAEAVHTLGRDYFYVDPEDFAEVAQLVEQPPRKR